MHKLDVYLDPCTINCRKVLAGLQLLDVPYNEHYIDYFGGGHKDPEYMKINPCATVPAAKDGDLVLTESNAILQYAADLSENATAYPKDLKERAMVNRWLLWEASVWFDGCYVPLVENVVKPLLKAEPDQAVLEKHMPRFHQLAIVLNDQLGRTKFIAGDNITIADIAIASPMHLWRAAKFPLDKYTNLTRWYGEIEKLPCWKNTQKAVEEKLTPDAVNGSSKQSTNGASNGDAMRVKASLNYTRSLDDQLTELYFYEDEEGKWKDIHEPGDDPKEVEIYDGWAHADQFHYDKNGFSLHKFQSHYNGPWEDEEGVRAKFYPEVVEFLKQTTGAKRVLVFDHTIRTKKNTGKKLTQETNTSQRAPVRLVHCDYTAESGPVRVKQLLNGEANELLKHRVAFFNIWKPLAKVEEMPLAMCDVTSTPKDDFFKLFLRYRDRTGENYVMKHNPAHKWWYFPSMTDDRVIVLKTYESDEQRARFVGHSAFEDPTTKPDAPSRESIEIRTIAFF